MNKIRALRAERGLTIQELAKQTDIDPATISLIENGRRKAQATTLGKLSRFFNVPVETLEELADTTSPERGAKGGAASKGKPKTKKLGAALVMNRAVV